MWPGSRDVTLPLPHSVWPSQPQRREFSAVPSRLGAEHPAAVGHVIGWHLGRLPRQAKPCRWQMFAPSSRGGGGSSHYYLWWESAPKRLPAVGERGRVGCPGGEARRQPERVPQIGRKALVELGVWVLGISCCPLPMDPSPLCLGSQKVSSLLPCAGPLQHIPSQGPAGLGPQTAVLSTHRALPGSFTQVPLPRASFGIPRFLKPLAFQPGTACDVTYSKYVMPY